MGPRGDVIVQFDWSAGEIIKTLDQLKIADHTLVLLSSATAPWWMTATRMGPSRNWVIIDRRGRYGAASTALLRAELGCRSSCAGSGV